MQRHNQTPFITIHTAQCRACFKCVENCPTGALTKMNLLIHKHVHASFPEHCIGCGKCVKICTNHAITQKTGVPKLSAEEVKERLAQKRTPSKFKSRL